MKTSDWIAVDGYCAMKIIHGGDPENIADRVAFIEKTPRVRVAPFDGKPGSCLETPDNWKQGPKGDSGGDPEKDQTYGYDPDSRKWCDAELSAMGYTEATN
jgi:hypothetical protein